MIEVRPAFEFVHGYRVRIERLGECEWLVQAVSKHGERLEPLVVEGSEAQARTGAEWLVTAHRLGSAN